MAFGKSPWASRSYDRGRGEDFYRRSLYTYWKRTVPPPTMMTFDAADRSYCTVRRQSTSTPLQALALLNDVQVVEAARHHQPAHVEGRRCEHRRTLTWMFRVVANRSPPRERICRAEAIIRRAAAHCSPRMQPRQRKLLKVGEAKNDDSLDRVDLAAGTVLAQTLLNHDEAVMRR